eukprot:GILI01008826.1.p3 GENE.GILI01008826.1~~GILI01008826.1.p3  ORF type:complete len:104 (-),score=19.74 GILI01008826.1:306-617(-)
MSSRIIKASAFSSSSSPSLRFLIERDPRLDLRCREGEDEDCVEEEDDRREDIWLIGRVGGGGGGSMFLGVDDADEDDAKEDDADNGEHRSPDISQSKSAAWQT